MATSEGIPSSIDIELLELNDNPYNNKMYFCIVINVTHVLHWINYEEPSIHSVQLSYALCVVYKH